MRRVSNADNTEILRALNQLNDVLREDDNLLIYYSGHGNRRRSGSYDAGYWLPVNAEAPPDDTFWVPTEQVTGHLARLKARRIMVIADSAFAGLLADNPAFLLASDPEQLRSDAYINLRLPNRSRLLMTSGVDAPVPRLKAGYTSVFADAFIEALQENEGVATGPGLFLDLLDELAVRQPELDPEFKAIRRAGDEVGDFFFVAGDERRCRMPMRLNSDLHGDFFFVAQSVAGPRLSAFRQCWSGCDRLLWEMRPKVVPPVGVHRHGWINNGFAGFVFTWSTTCPHGNVHAAFGATAADNPELARRSIYAGDSGTTTAGGRRVTTGGCWVC